MCEDQIVPAEMRDQPIGGRERDAAPILQESLGHERRVAAAPLLSPRFVNDLDWPSHGRFEVRARCAVRMLTLPMWHDRDGVADRHPWLDGTPLDQETAMVGQESGKVIVRCQF
jgi:hypothetical protein